MQDRVRQIMANVLGISPQHVDEGMSMDTVVGWDSVRHLNLILALEESFNVRFTSEETGVMTTYPDILQVLARHVQQTA